MLRVKVKNSFFDRKSVIDAVGRARAKALSRIGAFLRTRARSLLRRRKKIGTPGGAPSVHSDSGDTRSLKNVLFSYDGTTRSVVVGPMLLHGKDGTPHGVPNLINFGGTVSRRGKTYHYHNFPFMALALKAERENMPRQWAGAVRSS